MPDRQENPTPLPEPAITLLSRIRSELSADFAGRTLLLAHAPLSQSSSAAVAVALAPRDDRDLQVFSFNLYDAYLPFTLRAPLVALSDSSLEQLRRELAEPGRAFAAHIAGCLPILAHRQLLDLHPAAGISLAILSNAGDTDQTAAQAAIEVASTIALIEHFGLRPQFPPDRIAKLCREIQNHIAEDLATPEETLLQIAQRATDTGVKRIRI